MPAISAQTIVTFAAVVVSQLIAVSLLPKTEGYTRIGYSLASLALFAFSFAAMARLIKNGTALGILLPALSATIPLVTVVIGIVLYGESASVPKIVLLVIACGLIGVASRY
jgi:small multidrug resistance pump